METTVYNELRDELFKLKYRRDHLSIEIKKLESAKQEIETIIDEIDFILSKYGIHTPDNYIEDKGE